MHSAKVNSDRPVTRPFRLTLLLSIFGAPSLLCLGGEPTSAVVAGEPVVVSEPAPSSGGPPGSVSTPALGDDPATTSLASFVSGMPNVAISSAGGGSYGAIMEMRGLANTPYFSDPAVSVYIDDIPLGGGFSNPTDLFAFASASVFRGPQASAFGRASDGGVIRFLPSSVAGPAELDLGFGSYDATTASLSGTFSSGAQSSLTLALSSTQRTGYVQNTQIGERVDGLRASSIFAREVFRPSASGEVSIELFDDRHRDGAAPLVPLGGPLFLVRRAQEGQTDDSLFGAALKARVEGRLVQVTSVTSLTRWELNPYEDWLVLPPAIYSRIGETQDRWNEEWTASSSTPGPLAWSIGAWASTETTTGDAYRSINDRFPIENSRYHDDRLNLALFGTFTYSPDPHWLLALGLRAQRIETRYQQQELAPSAASDLHLSQSEQEILPSVTATRFVGRLYSFFAEASLGSRPGGFAAYTDNPALILFAAEHVASFETGMSRTALDKSLALTARAFDYEISNYQIERSFTATDYFVATAPAARSYGAEVEADWKMPRAWHLLVTAGWTGVTLLKFDNPIDGQDDSGRRAPYIPTYTGSLRLERRWTSGVFGSATLVGVGNTFYTEAEDAGFEQRSYAIVGLRTGIEEPHWRFTLYLNNALDRAYYSQIIPGVRSGAPGDPRTFGGDLTLKL
jgi:iron complex outermembrane receptor protein